MHSTEHNEKKKLSLHIILLDKNVHFIYIPIPICMFLVSFFTWSEFIT